MGQCTHISSASQRNRSVEQRDERWVSFAFEWAVESLSYEKYVHSATDRRLSLPASYRSLHQRLRVQGETREGLQSVRSQELQLNTAVQRPRIAWISGLAADLSNIGDSKIDFLLGTVLNRYSSEL